MSSIAGLVNFDGRPIDEVGFGSLLSKMNAGEQDYAQKWVRDGAGFGLSTFWTTPESLYEKQPLTSEDGALILVADARIDNRDDLMAELDVKFGQNLRQVITDAEIVLQAYHK